MRVRRTLPVIAFASALLLAVASWPTTTAAQAVPRQSRQSQEADYSASVKFDVNPNEAEVFLDGSYAGRVDDFDGIFQKLRVRPGNHDVVVYLDGYQSMRQRFYVAPDATRTLRFDLRRLGRGERADPRPTDRANGDWWDPRYNDSSARYGTVSLGIAPYDAEVWVDGRRWGNPPQGRARGRNERMALRLNPGRHLIEVRRPGYQAYSRDVNVPVGSTVNLNVSLRRG